MDVYEHNAPKKQERDDQPSFRYHSWGMSDDYPIRRTTLPAWLKMS